MILLDGKNIRRKKNRQGGGQCTNPKKIIEKEEGGLVLRENFLSDTFFTRI